MTSATEQRVLLLKPGDHLLIGNVGELDADTRDTLRRALATLQTHLGLGDVMAFRGDITIDRTPADEAGA